MPTMLTLLRVLLYVQVLMGLSRFAGLIRNERLWETHISIGIAIAVLALIALRPKPEVAKPRLRVAARFAPLLPLAMGLLIFTGTVVNLGFIWLHMVAGLATVGLIEAAIKREQQARAA